VPTATARPRTRPAAVPAVVLDRYRAQLNQALLRPDPDEMIAATGALIAAADTDQLFPELAALDLGTAGGRHKDLLDHSLKVAAKTPVRLRIRLAALLHDVGKPDTRHIDGRQVTFVGHEARGATIVRARLPKLGYPQTLVDQVATLVAMSGRFKSSEAFTDSAVRRFVRDAGEVVDDLLTLGRVDVTSKHQHKHDAQAAQVDQLAERIGQVAAADAAAAERPDLDGRQLMDRYGLEPGPKLGRILAELLAAKRTAGRPLTDVEADRIVTTALAG